MIPRVGLATIDRSTEQKLRASDGGPEQYFGSTVASAGDVDGDGYDDVLVGACVGAGAYTSGAVYVYGGGASGVDRSTEQEIRSADRADSDYFGYSASTAGDVNGDGYDDILVGATGGSAGPSTSGSAYVFSGGPDGLDGSVVDEIGPSDGADGDLFGVSVSTAGDVNGDGYDDLLVGAPYDDGAAQDSGSVYLYLGSHLGIDASTETRLSATDATLYDIFGGSVSAAGDLDGDGFDDVIIGSHADSNGTYGGVYLFRGSGTGIDVSSEDKIVPTDMVEHIGFGASVSDAGDLDGDGYADVLIGASDDATLDDRSGAVYVYYGGPDGRDPSREDKIFPADPGYNAEYGNSVSAAGDVDGDGFADILIGAFADDATIPYGGAAYVYLGGADGVDKSSEDKITASDLSRSGFGISVASAGDVNGDGGADLIVGAYFDGELGENAGAAYVYRGADLGEVVVDGDSGSPEGASDSGAAPDTGAPADAGSSKTGCATGAPAAAFWPALLAVLTLRRRARAQGSSGPA